MDALEITDAITRAQADGAHPVVEVLTPDELASGWAARLTGLDPEHGWARVFLSPTHEEPGPAEGLVRRRYELRRQALYQIHAPRLEAPDELILVRREGDALEIVEEEQAREALRQRRPAQMAEVEVAIAHQRWAEALKFAIHLPEPHQRAEALALIEQARSAQGRGGWVILEGSERQRRWAGAIRDRAAHRLSRIDDEVWRALADAEAEGERPRRALMERAQALAQASARLRTEPDAGFYVRQRHELEADEERFLYALASGQ